MSAMTWLLGEMRIGDPDNNELTNFQLMTGYQNMNKLSRLATVQFIKDIKEDAEAAKARKTRSESFIGESAIELVTDGNKPEGFGGMIVYHSTDEESASDIAAHGFKLDKSSGGYYGYATSVTDELKYSKSFGDWTVVARIRPGTRILDLSYPPDWDIWQPITKGHMENWHKKALAQRIQGVCDRGAGDIFLYDPSRLEVLGYFNNREEDGQEALKKIMGNGTT
jgi:hypothetical protein